MQVHLHGIRCIFALDKHPLAHAADVDVDLLRNVAPQQISFSSLIRAVAGATGKPCIAYPWVSSRSMALLPSGEKEPLYEYRHRL
jgi:hypothetical protein